MFFFFIYLTHKKKYREFHHLRDKNEAGSEDIYETGQWIMNIITRKKNIRNGGKKNKERFNTDW